MNKREDTIFALATPTGKSAIAVIRISGSEAINVVNKISLNFPKTHKLATLNTIIKNKKDKIDQTITTIFKTPKSYTGENMVELSIHGGAAIINKIIKTLNKFENLRIAEPGEFTRRAFENNKLDLTQVEAISDLVNAETEAQRKQALNHLSGKFSNNINKWADKIKKTLANIEAAIDFTDEDLPNNLILDSKEQIRNISKEIRIFIENNIVGEKIRSGYVVAILGKPNVGKSSFINAIAKRDIAIVTSEPGTTRDAIELFTDLKGFPVKFFDTAGIRKASNQAESLGVSKSYKISHTADVNLVFIENQNDIDDFIKFNNKIYVQSKIDILKKISSKQIIYYISSKNGDGIAKLLDKIYTDFLLKNQITDVNISRERHRTILQNTLNFLNKSLEPKGVDIFSEDIRLSLNEISKISGKVDIEDILDIIFSDFCIGK